MRIETVEQKLKENLEVVIQMIILLLEKKVNQEVRKQVLAVREPEKITVREFKKKELKEAINLKVETFKEGDKDVIRISKKIPI